MSRILVTGAGGFLGAAVAGLAADRGHDVIALVRNAAGRRVAQLANSCEVVCADLGDRAAVAEMINTARPDIIVHSAWEGVGGAARTGDIQFANIQSTVVLTDLAIAAGVQRIVGIGSQAEYGLHNRRIDESAEQHPFLLYGAAKLAAYHLARQRCSEAGVGFAWLRLFSVYGPGDNPDWLIPHVTAELLAGRAPRTSLGTQLWDYLHIADAADGVLAAALASGADGAFNLSSDCAVSVRWIIERLRDLARPGFALTFGEIPFGPNQILHLQGDNNRLCGATGWQPRIDLESGLASVVDSQRHVA